MNNIEHLVTGCVIVYFDNGDAQWFVTDDFGNLVPHDYAKVRDFFTN